MRVLFRERHIAGGVDVRIAGPQGLIGLRPPIFHSYICSLESKAFDVVLAPDAQQELVILKMPSSGLTLYRQPAICRAHRPEFKMQAYAIALELATKRPRRSRLRLRSPQSRSSRRCRSGPPWRPTETRAAHAMARGDDDAGKVEANNDGGVLPVKLSSASLYSSGLSDEAATRINTSSAAGCGTGIRTASSGRPARSET